MQHVQEFINYAKFVLWWVSLGVASSIGLGKFYLHISSLWSSITPKRKQKQMNRMLLEFGFSSLLS